MKPIVQERLADEVYQQLREYIFQTNHAANQRIDIEKIAQQLRVSRQPVVEAASRLAQEGLLVVRPRVGTFVRQLSSQDVHDILQARLMMELFALSHAAPQLNEVQEMYSYIDRMDALVYHGPFNYLSYNELDVQLHSTFIRLGRNPLLEKLYNGLHAQYVPVRAFYRNAHEHSLTSYGEHRTIVDDLARGNIAHAAALLETHIRNAESGIQHIFQQLQITEL